MSVRTGATFSRLLVVSLIAVASLAITAATSAAKEPVYSNFNTLPAEITIGGHKYPNVDTWNLYPGYYPVGGQIEPAETRDRALKSITTVVDSFTCEYGEYASFCTTRHPSKKYSYEMTASVYRVGAGNEPGELVATATDTVKLPYRPSTNPMCGSPFNEGRGYGEACDQGGYLSQVTLKHFSPEDAVIPAKAIVLLSDTPQDRTEGKYENIGMQLSYKEEAPHYYELPANGGKPSLGKDPVDGDIYVDGKVNTGPNFETGQANWEEFQPVIEVTATR